MLDKFENRILIITCIVIMIFIFSLVYAKTVRKIDLPECVPYSKVYTHPKITRLDSTTFQVFAVAQMWQFQPSQIYIPAGSTVDFYVTSKDVVHGFYIEEKNVNMMAVYGGINKTTVKFDKPGVYKITCHEYCGAGHQNMQAEVIVNFADQR